MKNLILAILFLTNFAFAATKVPLGSGVSGTLPVANGGTNNASMDVTAGRLPYADGTKLITLAPGSAGQYLRSDGSTAPTWSYGITQVKTTTYTVLPSDDFINASASGGSYTITLYTAVGNAGKQLTLTKIDSSYNQITIDGNGSEIVGANLTTTLATLDESITLVSDGANWLIKARYIDQSTKTVTLSSPTWNNANVTITATQQRIGDKLRIEGKLTLAGAPNTGALFFTIPNSLTIDTNKLPSTTTNLVPFGSLVCDDSGASTYGPGTFRYDSITSVATLSGGVSGATTILNNNVTHATPFSFGSGDSVSFWFVVPIAGWDG